MASARREHRPFFFCYFEILNSRSLILSCVISRLGARHEFCARDFDADLAPLAIVRAGVLGTVCDRVQGTHLGGNYRIYLGQFVEPANLMQLTARAIRQELQA